MLLALALGGAGGWVLRAPPGPTRGGLAMSLLEQEGLATHLVCAADKRDPIEVGVGERDRLSQWLSNRLSRKV